jgi:hypothetical protein
MEMGLLMLQGKCNGVSSTAAYAFRLTMDNRWKDRIWKELLVASGNTTQYFGENGNDWNSK